MLAAEQHGTEAKRGDDEDEDEVEMGRDEHGDFLNLATLQPGTQRVRDTSSYSSWLEVHQRRRDQQQLAEKARSPAKK